MSQNKNGIFKHFRFSSRFSSQNFCFTIGPLAEGRDAGLHPRDVVAVHDDPVLKLNLPEVEGQPGDLGPPEGHAEVVEDEPRHLALLISGFNNRM